MGIVYFIAARRLLVVFVLAWFLTKRAGLTGTEALYLRVLMVLSAASPRAGMIWYFAAKKQGRARRRPRPPEAGPAATGSGDRRAGPRSRGPAGALREGRQTGAREPR